MKLIQRLLGKQSGSGVTGGGMVRARNVAFSLYKGEAKKLEGFFTVTRNEGFCTFGTYHAAEASVDGETIRGDFFSGITFEHSMEDNGAISMFLKIYEVEPCESNAFKYAQILKGRVAIKMGCASGEGEAESIDLGSEYGLLWQTRSLA